MDMWRAENDNIRRALARAADLWARVRLMLGFKRRQWNYEAKCQGWFAGWTVSASLMGSIVAFTDDVAYVGFAFTCTFFASMVWGELMYMADNPELKDW